MKKLIKKIFQLGPLKILSILTVINIIVLLILLATIQTKSAAEVVKLGVIDISIFFFICCGWLFVSLWWVNVKLVTQTQQIMHQAFNQMLKDAATYSKKPIVH